MALDQVVSIHGIQEIGTWTALDDTAGDPTNEYNATNVYTRTSWLLTRQDGGRIVPTTQTVKQYSGQSVVAKDSFISQADAQLVFGMLSGTLLTLQRMLGLPTSALVGDLGAVTPTTETLVVKGSEIGTEIFQMYMKTMGPLGPRHYHFPKAKLATLPEIAHARTQYYEPQAAMDLYVNDADEFFWAIDATA